MIQFITYKDLGLEGISRSMANYAIEKKRLPPPIRIGGRLKFIKSEMDAVRSAQVQGASDEEVAKLIDSLVENRYHA